MARNHARVHVAIWQDPEFVRLNARSQRLYLFLLSQPNLNHLGVLPLTLRRWAGTSLDCTPETLEDDLVALEDARFVVVDDQAEELLVRTLLRNDGVYKQPNVMRGAIASVPSIHSFHIRRALLAEVDRIDLSDVQEDRRADARTLLTTLRDDLAKRSPNPTPTPSGRVTETPGEGFTEPQAIPPTHTRAQPLVLSPSSHPSHKDTSSPLRDDGFTEFWSAYPRKVGKQAAAKAYTKALRTVAAPVLVEAATQLRDDPNLPETSFVPHATTWLNRGGWDDPPYPTPLRAVGGRVEQGDALLRRWHEQALAGQIPELGA